MPDDPPSGQTPVNTGRNPDGTFAPGSRHNPKGKSLGARSKATKLLDAILYKNIPGIANRLVTAAKGGEHWAVTLALKDQLPKRATPFDLMPIDSAAEV